jgi:phosphatidylglycerol:prolipoprotein diacylglycerol transferase
VHFPLNGSPYGWLMLDGVGLSLALWSRLAVRDDRLVIIYAAALGGAFLGAKLAYLAAEGWLHWQDPNRWWVLATGKSITGALLGGYAGVELAKRLVGYSGVTGDWFALVAPLSIGLGRIGCLLHGCCLGRACQPSWMTTRDSAGVSRWPAASVELLFNLVAFGVAVVFRRRGWCRGQLFHIYLVAYGVFRFGHEFLRDTPAVLGPISGYQIASLCLIGLGVAGFVRRRSEALPAVVL